MHVNFNCDCECIVCGFNNGGVCNIGASRYVGVMALWYYVLCDKAEDEEFHCPQCLLGACSQCGVRFFNICPPERVDDTTRTIQWKKFQYKVMETSEEGKPKKCIKEVFLTTSFLDFMDFFTPTLQQFICHNFMARWQSKQTKLLHACL